MKFGSNLMVVMALVMSLIAGCGGSGGSGAGTTSDTSHNSSTTTTPVTTPAQLTMTQRTATTATLTWTASTGGSGGVFSYTIYRNGVAIGHTSKTVSEDAPTTYTDTGLTPGATYVYTVTASDLLGNESAKATTINVTTAASTGTNDGTFNGYTLQTGETAPTNLTPAMIKGQVFYLATSTGYYGEITFPVDGNGTPQPGVFAMFYPNSINNTTNWTVAQFTATSMPIIVTEFNGSGSPISVDTLNVVGIGANYYAVSLSVANSSGTAHLRLYYGADAQANARAYSGH